MSTDGRTNLRTSHPKKQDWDLLLDDLETMLERQIELVQTGNVSNVEVLSKQADYLVGKIAGTGVLELPEFKSRRELLRRLYGRLCLAITAQRADISEKLSRIRKGRKTIGVYRTNT
jgi:hypothetical protein